MAPVKSPAAVLVPLAAALLALATPALSFNLFQKTAPSAAPLVAPRVTPVAAARTSIIGGNWKMNPASVDEATELAKGVCEVAEHLNGEAIVFPPYPFLGAVAEVVKDTPVFLGAQQVYYEDAGAFTGAVAPSMVKSLGVEYVLAGHSERRVVFGETDASINHQVVKTIEYGMKPVLCIGETKEEYDAKLVEAVCAVQLAKDLAGVDKDDVKDMVIAYEPVWAIGTGLVCPADVAQKTHEYIRHKIAEMYDADTADAVRIQYGGSVSPESVDELMSMPDIDGCLVGGASLFADKFNRILQYE